MALQNFKGGLYVPDPVFAATDFRPGETGLAVALANEKVGVVFQAPRTGNVDQIAFRVLGHTTAATILIRVETVDAAGLPSGTLVATNTSGSVLTTGANTTHVITLTAVAALTRGTWYAIVIAQPAASAGSCTIQYWDAGNTTHGRSNFRHRLTYVLTHNATTWEAKTSSTQAERAASIGIRYSTPEWAWVPGIWPMSAWTRTQFNSGTNPNERGLKVRFAFPTRACGLFFFGSIDAQDYQVILYNAAQSALQTLAGDKDVTVGYPGQNYAGLHVAYFPADQDLAANTDYYLMLKPGSTTNVMLADLTILDTGTTAMMGSFNGGPDLILATRNGGAFSTDATKRAFSMGLILSGFADDAGGGGAGGAHILGGTVVR